MKESEELELVITAGAETRTTEAGPNSRKQDSMPSVVYQALC